MSILLFGSIVRAGAAASLLLLTLSQPSQANDLRYPPNSLLLFVASWCAPCHAEVARLPAIAAGARPLKILVVPIDAGRATRAMLRNVPPELIWKPEAATRRRIEAELFGETAGLPFSLATDSAGRRCASSRRGLDGARARALVDACRGASS